VSTVQNTNNTILNTCVKRRQSAFRLKPSSARVAHIIIIIIVITVARGYARERFRNIIMVEWAAMGGGTRFRREEEKRNFFVFVQQFSRVSGVRDSRGGAVVEERRKRLRYGGEKVRGWGTYRTACSAPAAAASAAVGLACAYVYVCGACVYRSALSCRQTIDVLYCGNAVCCAARRVYRCSRRRYRRCRVPCPLSQGPLLSLVPPLPARTHRANPIRTLPLSVTSVRLR